MFQQNFGQPQYPGPGYGYAPPQKVPMTMTLTAEEIRNLRNKSSNFEMNLTNEEVLRSMCNHRDDKGFTIIENQQSGTVTCNICGETFTTVSMDENAVQEAVNLVKDILQSVKTYHIDIPVETAREYFKIIPLLDRLPKFYKIAYEKFNRYEVNSGVQNNNNMYGFNMFNMLANPYIGNPMLMAQQQMMMPQQQQMQQPMMPQGNWNPFGPQTQFQPIYPDQQQMMMQQQPQMVQQTVQAPGPQNQQQQPQQVVSNKPFNIA